LSYDNEDYEEYVEDYADSDEDQLTFEINELKERNKTSFQSMINQKEISIEEMDDLFLGMD